MLIFDFETTGLPLVMVADLNKQPKAIEFAAIKLNDETLEEVDRIEMLINPEQRITDQITKITGIENKSLIDKPTFKDYYPKLVNFFLGEKYLFAHNIAFDMNILRFELQRLKMLTKFPFPPVQVCTVNQTRKMNGYNLNLSKLHEQLFGEPFEGAHRAMVDVEALTRCVKKLLITEVIKLKNDYSHLPLDNL